MKEGFERTLRMFLSTSVIYKFGIALIISCQLLLLYVGYLLFFPFNPLIVKNPDNLKVFPKVVAPGDKLNIVFDYCKDQYYRVRVDKQAVGKTQVYILPTASGNVLPVGCHVYNVVHTIPDDISSGEYYITVDLVYDINFVRKIRYSFRTEDFIIKGGER